MQSSMFNNPMFAQGLAGLVESFIGNPEQEARSQVLSSQALLNNQTAQYRDAMGEAGLGGDLSAMMIRALQAGPEYAGHAPTIGNAAVGFNDMGYGRLSPAAMEAALAIAPAATMAATPAMMPAAPQMQPQAAPQPQPQPQVQPQPQPQPMPAPMAAPQPIAPPGQMPRAAPRILPGSMLEQQVLTEARTAIAQGRAPNAVAMRVAEMGVDPRRI